MFVTIVQSQDYGILIDNYFSASTTVSTMPLLVQCIEKDKGLMEYSQDIKHNILYRVITTDKVIH